MRDWFYLQGFSKSDSKHIVDIFCKRIYQYLLAEKPVTIFGVGQLNPSRTNPKVFRYGGVSNGTDELTYIIPEKIAVKFRLKRSFELELKRKMFRINPKEWEEYYAGVEKAAIARGLLRRTKEGENLPIEEVLRRRAIDRRGASGDLHSGNEGYIQPSREEDKDS